MRVDLGACDRAVYRIVLISRIVDPGRTAVSDYLGNLLGESVRWADFVDVRVVADYDPLYRVVLVGRVVGPIRDVVDRDLPQVLGRAIDGVRVCLSPQHDCRDRVVLVCGVVGEHLDASGCREFRPAVRRCARHCIHSKAEIIVEEVAPCLW